MTALHLTLSLPSPEATAQMAARIGAGLSLGDVLLLDGPVGAGKTHFARSLIQSILLAPEDVPSPTFTLVQEYDTRHGPLWHADLYRLSGPDEMEELGLFEAFETAICLIEWPDRLGDAAPADALRLQFGPGADDDAREVTVNSDNARWADVVGAPA